mgnify:CR=1 FL=1
MSIASLEELRELHGNVRCAAHDVYEAACHALAAVLNGAPQWSQDQHQARLGELQERLDAAVAAQQAWLTRV